MSRRALRQFVRHLDKEAKVWSTIKPGEDLLPKLNLEYPKDCFAAMPLQRPDEGSDATFYTKPRLVAHVSDTAVSRLVNLHAEILKEVDQTATAHLDLCSSWQSHLPDDYQPREVIGVGMNEEELAANPRLSASFVQDLNVEPKLTLDSDTFDAATCAMSIDYLTRPIEVLEEVHRVLKPGGLFVVAFSNHFFETKAVNVWQQSNELQRVALTAGFFHYAAPWKSVRAFHEAAEGDDPLYLVVAKKNDGFS